MGPVGGDKLAGLPRETAERLGIRVHSSAELALRFVFANPNVDCALSGMSSREQVEENAVIASNLAPLSAEEVVAINAAMDENKRLADLYCTGCNYCLPYCPEEVNIAHIFQAMNYYRVSCHSERSEESQRCFAGAQRDNKKTSSGEILPGDQNDKSPSARRSAGEVLNPVLSEANGAGRFSHRFRPAVKLPAVSHSVFKIRLRRSCKR